MQVRAWIEPSEGKVGDSVTLKVQFTRIQGQIKSVYARTDQGCWQLNKKGKGEYSLKTQIPPFASLGTYNIHILAENEKKEKIVEITIPFLVKDKEVEEEPEFSGVNCIIQELESVQLNTILKETPHLLKRVENYVLSLRVAKRLISSQTYQTSLFLRKDPGVNQSSVSREYLSRLKRILSSGVEKIDLRSLAEGNKLDLKQSLAKDVTFWSGG